MKKSFSVSNFQLFSIEKIIKDGDLNLLQHLLIQNEVSLQYQDIYKNSLLHIAISYNQYNICKYLLEEGIHTNHVNIWHMTPLEQSIHMKRTKISNLLRQYKAFYKNKFDSEQIIFGERQLFFEKLQIIIENLVFFFPSAVQVNFFHHSYNSEYLFCCSKHYTKNASFQRYISNFILSLSMKMFAKKEFIVHDIPNHDDFMFLPYCKLFGIEHLVILPLKVNHILIGYFFLWNQRIEVIKERYETIIEKIMLGQYFELLQFSLVIYRYNIKQDFVKKFVVSSLSKVQQRILNYEEHVSIMKFIEHMSSYWNDLREDKLFQQLVFIVAYYERVFIPSHACFKLYQFNHSLYTRLQQENMLPVIQNFESNPFRLMKELKFDEIQFEGNKGSFDLSPFDVFNILGKEVTKDQYERLQKLYTSFDPQEYSFQVYYDIQNILFERKKIRDKNVLGIKNDCEHTFFVCHEEVQKAIDFVFTKIQEMNQPLTKIYYLFHTICQYIHPFVDGNGRTCRMVLNFYLKKLGHADIISRQEKMIGFEDFQKKFNTFDVTKRKERQNQC